MLIAVVVVAVVAAAFAVVVAAAFVLIALAEAVVVVALLLLWCRCLVLLSVVNLSGGALAALGLGAAVGNRINPYRKLHNRNSNPYANI